MDSRIYMFATFQAKPEKRDELLGRLLEMVKLTQQESVCFFYHLHVDRDSSYIFHFVECWEDQAALDFHMNTPYIKAIVSDAPDLTTSGIDIRFMNRVG